MVVLFTPEVHASGVNDYRNNKRLKIFNSNTSERFDGIYWRDGWFDPVAMKELNHFFRDWRDDAVIRMDPYVIDLIHEICMGCDYTGEVVALSGYRTSKTNEYLRMNTGLSVAENSFHILGRAIDFTLPSRGIRSVFKAAKDTQMGGIGYYPDNHFIHVDTGEKRIWKG